MKGASMFAVMALPLLLYAGGCDWSSTSRVEPAETMVKRVTTTTNADGSTTEEKVETSAKGAGVKGKDLESVSSGNLSADLDSASVGGVSLGMLRKLTGMKSLYLIGAGCLVAGVAMALLINWRLGSAVGFAGGTAIAVGVLFERYPWSALVGGGAVLVSAGWVLWDMRRSERARATAETLVQAIADSAPAAAEEIKGHVRKRAGRRQRLIKETVSEIKQKHHL